MCVRVCSLTSQSAAGSTNIVDTPPPSRSHAATAGLGYAQVASSHHSQTGTLPALTSLPVRLGWAWERGIEVCTIFCSVLQPSSIRRLTTPWTYFLHLSLSFVILIDSSTGSPVHVLMLSIQAVRGLPCLALFLALSLSPGNSRVSSCYDHSMLASRQVQLSDRQAGTTVCYLC